MPTLHYAAHNNVCVLYLYVFIKPRRREGALHDGAVTVSLFVRLSVATLSPATRTAAGGGAFCVGRTDLLLLYIQSFISVASACICVNVFEE